LTILTKTRTNGRANNKSLTNPQKYLLSSIQGYQLQLYRTGKDTLLDNMKRIAETILSYSPDHIESLSNIAVVQMLKKNYDKALESLLKAEQLNPKDTIVLSNIAQAYRLKSDKQNAILYYEKALKHGDAETKQFVKEQISKLKKQ
jgi:tetratricopeptide (TPR) repeat protein